MMKRLLLALVFGFMAWMLFADEPDLSKLPPASTQENVTYEKDIQPIFKEQCYRCHGPEKQRAKLRLDSLEAVLKGSKEQKVVLPGDGAKSPLVHSVARVEEDEAMPPLKIKGVVDPKSKPLTAEQVGLIRAWIDQGAK